MAISTWTIAILLAILAGILFVICLLLLVLNLYEHCKSSKNTKKLLLSTFIGMCLFTISLMFWMVKYILLTTTASDVHIITILLYLFYGSGLMVMMYVWVQRIDITFQGSSFAYAATTIRNLRMLYFATVYTCFQCFFTSFIVRAFRFNRIFIWIAAAIFALSFTTLSIILLFCFLQKLSESITTAKVVSASVTSQITIRQQLVELHAKFSILSTLSITSTFCALIGVIVLDVLLPIDSRLSYSLWLLPLLCDNVVGFVALFCTLKMNKKYYFALFGCWHSMIMKKRNAMFGTHSLLPTPPTPVTPATVTTTATTTTTTTAPDAKEMEATTPSTTKAVVITVTAVNIDS